MECQLLDSIAVKILTKNTSLRMVSLVLVSLCFIFSMFITNDVALITFVPLTMIIASLASLISYKFYAKSMMGKNTYLNL